MFTLYAIGASVALLVINITLAGISHHVKAITPLWLLAMFLNKLSVTAIPICIIIDIFSLF